MWSGFYVYIVASRRNGTLYIGMTDDLLRRVSQHKHKLKQGFTSRYGCDRLVWFECHPVREAAFRRERALKAWKRGWKLRLIEERNPQWRDLFYDLNAPSPYPLVPAKAGIQGEHAAAGTGSLPSQG